jgi:hypothetical protein
VNEEGKPKPKLEKNLIFFHRFGVLERELWAKTKCSAERLRRRS